MRLLWVELRDFRSYHECLLRPDPGTNVLIGPNGAGKTNFLEAVSYVGWLRSFRRVPEQSMVLEGAPSAVIRAELTSGDTHTLVAVEVPVNGRRRVALNGKLLRTPGDLSDHIRVVVFFPDDLDIVKRGPGGRREFLDHCGAQLWPGAGADLQDYDRALRQRNALLKRLGRDFDLPTLQVWDERLSQAAGRVMSRRARTMRMLDRYLSEVYAVLAGGPAKVQIDYRSSWLRGSPEDASEVEAQLLDGLGAVRGLDADRRMTTVGPHRDDPSLLLDGHEARTYLSQGEQRTLALALRLATHHAILDQTGEEPILLLDDVFSELDRLRAGALGAVLPDSQTFITTTAEEEVPVTGVRFRVVPGSIR